MVQYFGEAEITEIKTSLGNFPSLLMSGCSVYCTRKHYVGWKNRLYFFVFFCELVFVCVEWLLLWFSIVIFDSLVIEHR